MRFVCTWKCWRQEYLRRGMSPQEARYAALRSFGGVDQTKERYREQRGLPFC